MTEYFVHGVRATVRSNWSKFLQLVGLNLAAFRSRDDAHQSLSVDVHLDKKGWLAPSPTSMALRQEEEKWGAGFFVGDQTARLQSETISVEFVAKPRPAVSARFVMDRRTQVARLYKDVPSWGTCQGVMRLALYHPIFHLLEQRGISLLHAAAVASAGAAHLIVGLNGIGKSSLCFELLDGFDYMSDNLVLWDGEFAMGLPEALRLPVAPGASRPKGVPVVFGKVLTPVQPEKTVLRARPKEVYILTQGPRTSLTPLSPDESMRRIRVIHDMTHEFPRHTFLGPLSRLPETIPFADLLATVPTFALTMSNVKEAAALIRRHA